MHLHWEKHPTSAGDCNIRSMSWMGRVPDEIPQEEGWKLNRTNYYQEGWLSTASLRGVVGVTFTTSHCATRNGANAFKGSGQELSEPARTNYNLRGHRSEVTMVRWNEPYQKLASCDSSGIIFVWIKYEGRWSIELINDRNTPVSCFAWSHDGRMALICYQDGFILVGSVQGHRDWGSNLPPDTHSVTCGTWTPDDKQVYLGTAQGRILVMDVHGNSVGRVLVSEGSPVTELAWNCERFSMEEPSESSQQVSCRSNGKPFQLACCLKNGDILLMRSYDDIVHQVIKTGFQNYVVDWTNNGEMLAVAGKAKDVPSRADHSFTYVNAVKFYNDEGNLIYQVLVPSIKSPVTAMTWGHNDKRLFLATGNQVHVGWVSQSVASLQILSRLKVYDSLQNPDHAQLLPLPCRIQNLIEMLFTNTIKSCVPNPSDLLTFATKVHAPDLRLYCTMIRHTESTGITDEGSQEDCYTLYLEHLGGFLPILKGKKTSKLRPEFVIFDPTLQEDSDQSQWIHVANHSLAKRGGYPMDFPDASSNETVEHEIDDTATPRTVRRRPPTTRRNQVRQGLISNTPYANILPESNRLIEITSNIWGTKFQISSQNLELLPEANLGEIIYKASLLHLQPRQMRLELPDMHQEYINPFTDDSDDDDEWFQPGEGFESEGSSNLDNPVLMRNDILRAVAVDEDKAEAAAPRPRPNIAPIAPLPTRLSFCLPGTGSSRNTPCSPRQFVSNETAICEALESVKEDQVLDPARVKSPVKANAESACPVHVTDNPVVSPLKMKPSSGIMETSTCSMTDGATALMSPSKLRLRMSVSCDNYLAEGKFCLSRRDSVGSGSPHSSRGSPRRWAAKVEEVAEPGDTPTHGPAIAATSHPVPGPSCSRAGSSVNDLDVIVDLLGVPSDLLAQRDLSKRLILLNEKRRKRLEQQGTSGTPLEQCGKSLSCEDESRAVKRRQRRKDIELKRRSIYSHTCRGRNEAKTCDECEQVAKEVNDSDLNREIFDVPSRKPSNIDLEHEIQADAISNPTPEPFEESSMPLPKITENIPMRDPKTRSSSVPRRFDAVRSLLEKVRSALLLSKSSGARHRRWNESKERDNPDSLPQSQSSPCTPLPKRKARLRNRSFSPVRTLLNSPMLRRRRKSPDPDATSELPPSEAPTPLPQRKLESSPEVLGKDQTLETQIQKRQLRQKLKTLKETSPSSSAVPKNSAPTPTPQFLSPFMPRKTFLPSSPNLSLLNRRLGLSKVSGVPAAPPPVKARIRRKLILRNKSPMWNETSQVYQLDFGGRVTQESAKNFQIEYKDKQVMQFGRIDSNAYTLDFQYPFTAAQAFGVALANVTQRLK